MVRYMQSRTYTTETYWERYQPYFPSRARITPECVPEEEWFDSNGTSIHLDRYPEPDSPITVVMVHGAGGYGRLFASACHLLRKAGYEVVAPDLPGYGLSRADPSLVNYGVWLQVLRNLVVFEHRRRDRQVVLFGASIGGYLAYLCAASMSPSQIAGVIATTLADPRDSVTRKQFAKNSLVLKLGLPILPFFAKFAGRLRIPIKWFTKMNAMSNNPALSDLVARDPMGGGAKVPLAFMHSIFQVRPDVEPDLFTTCPVLLVHPGEDRWTPVVSSRLFFEKIRGEKYIRMLDKCGHFPVEEPGFSQLEDAVVEFLARLSHSYPKKTQQSASFEAAKPLD
jgi:alpha-beta hydrolase superfamily lysophospholipase